MSWFLVGTHASVPSATAVSGSSLLFLLVLGTSAPGACLLGGGADPAGRRPVQGQQGRWVYSGPRRREAIFVVGAEWLASGQERVLAGVVDVSGSFQYHNLLLKGILSLRNMFSPLPFTICSIPFTE